MLVQSWVEPTRDRARTKTEKKVDIRNRIPKSEGDTFSTICGTMTIRSCLITDHIELSMQSQTQVNQPALWHDDFANDKFFTQTMNSQTTQCFHGLWPLLKDL